MNVYCSMPTTHCYIDEDGSMHLCCPGWLDAAAGNVLLTDPMKIWRGAAAREIRTSVMNDSFHHCRRCQFLPGPRECVVNKAPAGATADPPDEVSVLTLNYDPTCNLRCSSCRSRARSATERTGAIHESLWRSELPRRVRHLSASGSGDPLASELIWGALCRLTELGCRPDMTVGLQSNGILLDPERWNELGPERQRITRLSISVDAATEETYRQNRGGNFNRLLRNLEHAGKMSGVHLQLNFVVQENNFLEMEDFTRMAQHLGAERCYFAALCDWDTWSKDEHEKRAVHLPGHPRREEFLKMLKKIESFPDVTTIGF